MIIFSDSKSIKEANYFEDIYISDSSKQELHFSLSKKIPNLLSLKGNSMFEKTFFLSLTRFSLQRNQFLIPYLISEKFNNDFKDKRIKLIISKKNKYLGEYLKIMCDKVNKINVEYHNQKCFWKNGLTKNSFSDQFKIFILSFLAILYTFFFILLFKIIPKRYPKLEWMSFANNKEAIDYSIIEKIKSKDISLSYPSIIPFQNKFSKLIFRSRSYSIINFISFSFSLLFYLFSSRANLKEIDKKYPIKFHLSFRCIAQLIYQYLLSFETNEISNIAIFRGGNSNGIWKSSLNPKITTILLSHGTEIYPIDHAIYLYTDYYILPSTQIVAKWHNYIKKTKNTLNGRLVSIGRPFYETLRLKVNSVISHNNDDVKVIGVVLTYSSNERTKSFILNLFNSLKDFKKTTFLVKERTNFQNDLSYLSNHSNIKIHSGDIFSFLSLSDFVIAGISDLSVLGMTVLDAISLNIPAIYYTQGRNQNDLGYSFCEEMSDYTFKEIEDFDSLIDNFSDFTLLLNEIRIRNIKTKEILGLNYGVIDEFINFTIKLVSTNETK